MNLAEISDRTTWDAWVDKSAWGHPLQLWGWGETKRPNWQPVRLALVDENGTWHAAAQVLLWRIPKLGRKIAYLPRGPVAESGSEAARMLLEQLVGWARSQGVLYVRAEPAWEASSWPAGWVRARDEFQLSQTYTIDLSQSEDNILAAMSHKHRQYIRKGERDGVQVLSEANGNVGPMFEIYTETASRAGFGIHPREYYEKLLSELGTYNCLYYALANGKPCAFLWLAVAGETAYELYGGVNEQGQELKANYALKWRVMVDMKAANKRLYDFNGRLNEGVSRFKEGFGPTQTSWTGTWDRPLNTTLYAIWRAAWPVTKKVGRRVAQLRRK